MSQTDESDALPEPQQVAQAGSFEASYIAGTPPWDIGRPQPMFAALAASGAFHGRVLDVGCGTGEHVLMAAEAGLDATGIDAAPTAIARAESKARQRGIAARFRVGDALDLNALGEQFDTVLDSGLFHSFDDADRARYVAGLHAVLSAGGRFHMLCFSDRQPGTSGPRRVSKAEIEHTFAKGWQVESIERVRFETTDGEGAAAWLVSVMRI